MIVKNILLGKPENVVTIEPTADLTAALKLLAERRIGAVVILGADHRIVGILSERDIVRALAERRPTALHEPVGQVMTRDVTTCSEDDTIESLMERSCAQQEANAAPPPASDNTMSGAQPTVPADSFDSRWGGSQ
jgi:CBS domain-containing protein